MGKIKNLVVTAIIIGACSGIAMADGIFTPLNFSDAQYTNSQSTKIAAETTSIRTNATANTVNAIETTGSKNMQSAISQLDNAQVEVRNELLNYKTKYSEVDARYNSVKTERANLAKQIKACEKKIRQLDNAKEKIRRNMISQ